MKWTRCARNQLTNSIFMTWQESDRNNNRGHQLAPMRLPRSDAFRVQAIEGFNIKGA